MTKNEEDKLKKIISEQRNEIYELEEMVEGQIKWMHSMEELLKSFQPDMSAKLEKE